MFLERQLPVLCEPQGARGDRDQRESDHRAKDRRATERRGRARVFDGCIHERHSILEVLEIFELKSLGVGPDHGYVADEELYPDRCPACFRTVEPHGLRRNANLNGHDVARAFYTCTADHDHRHVGWWTDWRDFVPFERVRIVDPSTGGDATTWGGMLLPPQPALR
jgi:hypothetical protein